MGALALVRIEGFVNREITIDGVQYHSVDWESFRFTDSDERVRESNSALDDLLEKLSEITAEHGDDDQVTTAEIDLGTLQITMLDIEEL